MRTNATSAVTTRQRTTTQVLDDSTHTHDCSSGSPDPDGWTVRYIWTVDRSCPSGYGKTVYASGRTVTKNCN